MVLTRIAHTLKQAGMLAALTLVWFILGMLYTERFIPPFTFLKEWLTPWYKLYEPTVTPGLQGRLEHLSMLLERSTLTSNLGMLLMITSLVALVAYASSTYQQKQKRTRENELLVMKNREIARRNEFIRYISATISHEFKNNLGRIKRRLDLSELDPSIRDRIEYNLIKLFSDIDIFKKIADEREAGLIAFEKTDVMEMLQYTASKYADLMDVHSERHAMDTNIYAAVTLLRTVFENILDNAVKYKKPGQEKARIHLSCTMDRDGARKYVSLSIRDEGTGMTEQEAEECFYKGKASGDRDSWGVGLYFAKYVVGLHAGKIRIGMEHTREGEGTEIIMKLPYVEEAINV